MTLDIGNDALRCKVFPASLQGQALSWFHHLPPNSVDNFRDLSEAFVGQYLCSARHKQNISTLQNIKMRDNESLREFVKRFGQAVLQVEACRMDAVLQIFKRSIYPGTPFFESLAKKPPTTMDDLFRRANKYSMLEDDVRAATQQVLVAGQASRSGMERSANFWTGKAVRPKTGGAKSPERPPLTPLSISYEKLLPMIQGLSDFRWPRPQGTDHPKEIIARGVSSTRNMVTQQRHAVRERINSIRPGLTGGGSCPIDGTIIFPPVDPTRTLQPHRDALILSLEIGDFDVRRILVDPGSSTNLVQASIVTHMGHSLTGLETLGESYPDSTGHQLRRIWLHYMKVIPSTYHQMAHSDMNGIHPSITSHKLNVLPTTRPIRQKVRRFHPDRQKIIRSEIDKLLEVGFIREVDYSDWLANVVVVPKKEGKWRVCVDYTNLNNACPKDSFPLPRIDQIVDSTTGQGMLSFLHAFSGYHQIPMSPANEEKTAFITPHGHTVEIYIDDIVVKSKTQEEHVLHLQEVFHLLRKYDMKLNPFKCAFGVSAGKFLGFMVSQRGIEVSPDQVKAVMETPPPRARKSYNASQANSSH
ncbi:Transposon Ty3-G Gag-Pol polyprotein [Vitis vinifera]|uniref:Transposon Ty3-G Gag-Pol polyprotein n=1 Tax=Vitis vinifera TaxID=29760 RepID=A0A438CUT9_VITVI|nr:Transposon Ty3-G Gag-Pol polyprotein [Vitis vinifera]